MWSVLDTAARTTIVGDLHRPPILLSWDFPELAFQPGLLWWDRKREIGDDRVGAIGLIQQRWGWGQISLTVIWSTQTRGSWSAIGVRSDRSDQGQLRALQIFFGSPSCCVLVVEMMLVLSSGIQSLLALLCAAVFLCSGLIYFISSFCLLFVFSGFPAPSFGLGKHSYVFVPLCLLVLKACMFEVVVVQFSSQFLCCLFWGADNQGCSVWVFCSSPTYNHPSFLGGWFGWDDSAFSPVFLFAMF